MLTNKQIKLYFNNELRWKEKQLDLLDEGYIISAWEFSCIGQPEHGYYIELYGHLYFDLPENKKEIDKLIISIYAK